MVNFDTQQVNCEFIIFIVDTQGVVDEEVDAAVHTQTQMAHPHHHPVQ